MTSESQSESGGVVSSTALLGPWTSLADSPHCCERTLNGKRAALIEKTPRVLNQKTGEWEYGPKGSGGTDSEKNQLNGYYPSSREWADKRLAELYGPNDVSSHREK